MSFINIYLNSVRVLANDGPTYKELYIHILIMAKKLKCVQWRFRTCIKGTPSFRTILAWVSIATFSQLKKIIRNQYPQLEPIHPNCKLKIKMCIISLQVCTSPFCSSIERCCLQEMKVCKKVSLARKSGKCSAPAVLHTPYMCPECLEGERSECCKEKTTTAISNLDTVDEKDEESFFAALNCPKCMADNKYDGNSTAEQAESRNTTPYEIDVNFIFELSDDEQSDDEQEDAELKDAKHSEEGGIEILLEEYITDSKGDDIEELEGDIEGSKEEITEDSKIQGDPDSKKDRVKDNQDGVMGSEHSKKENAKHSKEETVKEDSSTGQSVGSDTEMVDDMSQEEECSVDQMDLTE